MSAAKQWQFLKKAAELGKVPHALLFSGPDSEEKITSAFEFIKLINGQEVKIGHPDLLMVEVLPEEKEIIISQIRELQLKLSLRSYSAPYKSVIINKAHYLNQQAQSAFLKLLEEPKGQTLFILITEYPEMLLPTILSRVERLRFYSPLSKTLPKDEIKRIQEISRGDLTLRFQYAKELAGEDNLKEILENWLQYFRQVKNYKILKILQNIHYLISTTNVNRRLALEILMLEL